MPATSCMPLIVYAGNTRSGCGSFTGVPRGEIRMKAMTASPTKRIHSLRKYLVPEAISRLIAVVIANNRGLSHWNHRIEALDRMIAWAERARDIEEFRDLVFQSRQIGNIIELALAMRVLLEEGSAKDVRIEGLADDDLTALRQILEWWRDSMSA